MTYLKVIFMETDFFVVYKLKKPLFYCKKKEQGWHVCINIAFVL